MKTTVLALSIIVISLGVSAWLPALPWYTVFVLAVLAGIIAGRTGARAFLTGAVGAGLFWALLLLIMHLRNEGLLTGRISGMISDLTGLAISGVVLLILLSLVSALLGGLAALSGQLLTAPTDHMERIRRRRKKRGGSYKLKI